MQKISGEYCLVWDFFDSYLYILPQVFFLHAGEYTSNSHYNYCPVIENISTGSITTLWTP